MAKLTKDQWLDARAKWERSSKDGFEWLSDELGVSRPAVSKRAKAENWTKKVTQKVTPDSEKVTQKVTVANKESKANLTSKLNTKEPSGKYKESYAEEAYRLCLMGATDNKLADFFEVSEQTINNWKAQHPVFFESLKRGKRLADAQVAESLYNRATGYTCKDTHVSNFQGAITLTELDKHYPPDTVAAIFWLKNRQPEHWRDKHEHEVSATLDKDAIENLRTVINQRLEDARARNRAVLIERGIIIEG